MQKKSGGIIVANISIDAKLLEVLNASTCFGIAYDADVPECKQCDVKGSCKAKMEGGLGDSPIPTHKLVTASTPVVEEKPKAPAKPKATTPKAEKPKADKPKAPTPAPANLPDFKPMSLDELKDLAKERNVEWKDYGSDNITRMRLIMGLKKSY